MEKNDFGKKERKKVSVKSREKKRNVPGKKRNSPSVGFDLVWGCLDKHWKELEIILLWPLVLLQFCRVK